MPFWAACKPHESEQVALSDPLIVDSDRNTALDGRSRRKQANSTGTLWRDHPKYYLAYRRMSTLVRVAPNGHSQVGIKIAL